MNKSDEYKRIVDLDKSFLNPQLSNINYLEKYFHDLLQILKKFEISETRIEKTEKESYLDRIQESKIPERYSEPLELLEKIGFYLQGLIKWNSPGVMINVNPPTLLLPIVVNAYCMLFNPNLAMDVPAGNIAYAELEVVKMLSDLVGWNFECSGGVFTFGGKGTVLYAIRVGLNECAPEIKERGLGDNNIKVFSTIQGHPCHYEDCEWLGIGKENCIRLPLNSDNTIKMSIAEREMEKAIMDGCKIACIIVNGGSTLYTTIDEIDEMVNLRDKLVKKYNLSYKPHIHVDSVIGWAWLMFKDYDFENNPLNFSEAAKKELQYIYHKIRKIELADSFGADFHKTGFVPYLSSVFVIKDKNKLFSLGEEKQPDLKEMEFGLYAPFTYTLESSRSATSALSAWISLKQLGKEGYQSIIGTLVEAGCFLRNYFENSQYAKCANLTAHGFAALAMLFPQEIRNKKDGDLELLSDNELLKIAQYNHKFYLYMLELQSKNRIDFALDYVSKHTTVKAIKIGVIKLYPMSPYCNLQYLNKFIFKFEKVIEKFDELYDHLELKDSPYRPKPFVTR